jgi:hypothetical protein
MVVDGDWIATMLEMDEAIKNTKAKGIVDVEVPLAPELVFLNPKVHELIWSRHCYLPPDPFFGTILHFLLQDEARLFVSVSM